MRLTILFSFLLLILLSCVKKQLKETNLTLSSPIESATYHKDDTVFISGELSYKKKINDIGLFIAMVNDENDSTFFTRTILPIEQPYHFNEFYINDFDKEVNVTVNYGKRHIKSNQIYELKQIKIKLIP